MKYLGKRCQQKEQNIITARVPLVHFTDLNNATCRHSKSADLSCELAYTLTTAIQLNTLESDMSHRGQNAELIKGSQHAWAD